MEMEVRVWEEQVVIPTYGTGKPEKNPVFLEKRVYQGSSGVIYPYPVIEKILDEKSDRRYSALYLENEFLKIMILPELGGRVQMAWDKTMKRHFIYYNQVIKPALVGLAGPWISGGIEFNWPQHHRPNTFGPVDYSLEENSDGSKTAWVSEVERMSGTKMMAGFTLHPGKAYLEIRVRLFNRTPVAQTFLWWANPAVKVNDHYQSVFPPDVHAVFDHGKRDVSKFPIADGTYYKVDYSAGVDISRYKNIPVPTSYMAIRSEYDFVGGYEHDTGGGVLHIANHHISPGKKQWTWGNGDFGKAWDRNLTDEDGPYIELMAGVFTDNQPDFSWIQPYEERSFEQYFLPYKDLGLVKNANINAAVNLEMTGETAKIGVYATAEYKSARVILLENNKEIFNAETDLTPQRSFKTEVNVKATPDQILLLVKESSGKELISYKPESVNEKIYPEPAKPAKKPQEIRSVEQLYLTGLHLEQYRHATYDATAYYREALTREPGDVRNNNALGLWLLKRCKFRLAENHFRMAIETLTEFNPNPADGEPFFNLGLSLEYQGRYAEAFTSYYKASWNDAWQASAFFHLARLSVRNNELINALDLISKALIKNHHNHRARHLKALVLRLQGKTVDALDLINESLGIDQFNMALWFESFMIHKAAGNLKEADMAKGCFRKLLRNDPYNYIEYALDYSWAGQYQTALELLKVAVDAASPNPMIHYYMGYFAEMCNEKKAASVYWQRAAVAKPDLCFPNKIEDLIVLQLAVRKNTDDAKALYYLGNLWYDKRQYEDAMECWEDSMKKDNFFPTVQRNLALAYYNKKGNPEKAAILLKRAFNLDTTDSRILMELDQLNKKMQVPAQKRLELLDQYRELVEYRDDLYLERAALLNWIGNYDQAMLMIALRKFHPWEGGEGKVVEQYKICRIELAKKAIHNGEFSLAIVLLSECMTYPNDLGEGKLSGTRENDIHYWLGLAYELSGNEAEAHIQYEMAAQGSNEPGCAIFYNDQKPDMIFYQGLACLKLQRNDKALQRFEHLADFGEKHLHDKVKLDYFAVSLPDLLIFDEDLTVRNTIHCRYLIGLGNLGLGEVNKAASAFKEVLAQDCYHWGAFMHLKMINSNTLMTFKLKKI